MAAVTPFEALVVNSLAGKSVSFAVTTTSQSGTIDSTGGYAPSLMVAFAVPNVANVSTAMGYVRFSKDTTQAATNADIPLAPNTVTLFANPVPTGSLTVQVIVSVSSTLGPAIITVCPGEGGI